MERSYFFDSATNDRRLYNADDWAVQWRTMLTSGVFVWGENKDNLAVTASGLNVTVAPGCAIINGRWYYNDAPLTLPVASGTRVDRLVLRLNLSPATRNISAMVVQGSASTPPALTRNDTVYDLSLARLGVSGSSVTVTDERYDADVCGIVALPGYKQDGGGVPSNLLMYMIAPETLTATERAQIEGNQDYMAMWEASRIAGAFAAVDKTNANVAALIASPVKIHTITSGTGRWYPGNYGLKAGDKIGIWMCGGGGGGPAARVRSAQAFYASGGASGYSIWFTRIIDETDIAEGIPYVVGQGGISVTATAPTSGYDNVDGNNGSATSFWGREALGGMGGTAHYDVGTRGADGGQASCAVVQNSPRDTPVAPYGGIELPCESNGSAFRQPGVSQPPQFTINPFEPELKLLAAGGSAYGTSNVASLFAQVGAPVFGGKGGNGIASSARDATAQAATGYGNGGGAVICNNSSSGTATSGKGSPGAILIYLLATA